MSVRGKAAKIETLREQRAWTQEDLANRAHVSARSIGTVEQGKPVSIKLLQSIATALGVSYKEILDGTTERLTLAECSKELMAWENRQTDTRPLVVQTLAIDLVKGIDYIMAAINATHSRELQFQIVMLTGSEVKLPMTAPGIVHSWAASARANLAQLIAGLDQYDGEKSIVLEVKEYAETPRIHGVKLSKNRSKYCISECFWEPGKVPYFTWGDDRYEIVDDATQAMLGVQLRSQYDCWFAHLWRTSERIFDWEYPKNASR